MQYIQDAMAQNRDKISQLKEKLRTSTIGGDKLKKMVDDLSAQLEAQKQRVQELEAQLAEKDIVIAQQGEAITSLNENVNTLAEENKTKTQTVTEQDKQLHTAWYVFGTKSELKEQKILKDIPDVRVKFQKTQISFYNKHMFACASFMRVRKKKDCPEPFLVVTFSLPHQVVSPRIDVATEPYPGRWTHHVLTASEEEIDDELMEWIRESAVFSSLK